MVCRTPQHSVTSPHFLSAVIKYIYITSPLCRCGSNSRLKPTFNTWQFSCLKLLFYWGKQSYAAKDVDLEAEDFKLEACFFYSVLIMCEVIKLETWVGIKSECVSLAKAGSLSVLLVASCVLKGVFHLWMAQLWVLEVQLHHQTQNPVQPVYQHLVGYIMWFTACHRTR